MYDRTSVLCLGYSYLASIIVTLWYLFRQLRKDCQLLLFSATYDDAVMRFAENIVSNAMVFKLKREEQSLDNIKQYYIECESVDDKFTALSNIYGTISIGQSMIFCHVSIMNTD
jgi:ATP-dependent RNA helicase DDX19/DBP5